jgi:hypothetical protein
VSTPESESSTVRRTLRSTGASPAPCNLDSSSVGGSPTPWTPPGVERGTFEPAGVVGSEGRSPQLVGHRPPPQRPEGELLQGQPPQCPERGLQHSTEQGPSGQADGGLTEEVPLRRSAREVKRPAYLGDYVSCGQTVQWDTWQFRVHVLLQLMSLFPLQQREILNTILYVITHFS